MQRFVPGNRARCRDGHHAVAAHAAVRFVARDVIRKRLIHLTEIAFSAALTVRKKRNYAVSIGGDMASDKPITAQQAADLLIVLLN